MKTSQSIEEQAERKAARDNSSDQAYGLSLAATPPVRQKLKQRDASRISAWRWKAGQSGNPTGARHDLAAQLARAVFENNMEEAYRAFSKAIRRGNAYCFKELADRAYGKLKERVEHEVHPFSQLSEEDLLNRIAELERQLGISSAPEVLPPASDPKLT